MLIEHKKMNSVSMTYTKKFVHGDLLEPGDTPTNDPGDDNDPQRTPRGATYVVNTTECPKVVRKQDYKKL